MPSQTTRRSSSRPNHWYKDPSALTVCELQIIPYLVNGMADQRIACLLNVEIGTVRSRTAHMRQKLGAYSRSDLIRILKTGPDNGRLIANSENSEHP